MKKIYISIIGTLLISLGAFCQNLETTVVETHLSEIIGTSEAGELKSHLSLTNNGNSDTEVKCRREIINQVAGSDERFCWGGTCYGNGTDESGLTYTMAPGETYQWDEFGISGFTGYYNANENSGITQLRFTFFEVGNESNSTAVTIHYCVDEEGTCSTLLNVENKSKAELKTASPNPANSQINISYSLESSNSESSIVIRNALGMIVDQISTAHTNGNVQVDVTKYQSGMYTYSLMSRDQTLGTKRFIVAH